MILEFTLKDINKAAEKFLAYLKKNNIKKIAFYGKMGSGKTTFIKILTKLLKSIDSAVSPTFSIINEYQTENGQYIYHFDLYRLKNIEELLNIGAEEYLYSDNWIFIEWPQIAEPILPEDVLKVKIEEINEQKRKLTLLKN